MSSDSSIVWLTSKEIKKVHKKSKKTKKKLVSSSDSYSSDDVKKTKKHKKSKKNKKKLKKSNEKVTTTIQKVTPTRERNYRPMTMEEWKAQQSVVRRVEDPDTGRMRLVKGDGEILEEIVTRKRHLEINKNATLSDGLAFQKKLRKQLN